MVWAPLPPLALLSLHQDQAPQLFPNPGPVRGWPGPHPHLDIALNEGALEPLCGRTLGVALWGMRRWVAEEETGS